MGVILKMEGITKTFGNTVALKNVDFDLRAGEIHALLGENGAGKSTLIKILGGVYKPDKGDIFINGEKVHISGVPDARRAGVDIIHQEIVLVQNLSIAENIFLGREIRKNTGLIDYQAEFKRAQEMVDKLGIKLDVHDQVKSLTIAQQQLVEIVKAVSFHVRILVMDEPTSSLSDEEVSNLFDLMRKLKHNNVGIIYISHRFDELYEVTDRITVMRDGSSIETVETESARQEELLKLMVGRSMESFYVKDYVEPGDVILNVENLSKKGLYQDVSFEVRAGEIVGFSGLVGAGRSEIMMSVFGGMLPDGGKIVFKGNMCKFKSTKDAIDAGIGMVPEDRKKLGLMLSNSVAYNISLASIRKLVKRGLISEKARQKMIHKYSSDLSIKAASVNSLVSSLSGGNQQKILVSKWIATAPSLLILDEPTRGIDVGAKREIYAIMNELAKNGMAIVLISSELPEIVHMSDVVYVVRNGTIVRRFERGTFDQENIMAYATGGVESE